MGGNGSLKGIPAHLYYVATWQLAANATLQ